jgi:hypothetical protein
MTSTKPSAPNHLVYIGVCIKSHATEGIVFVNIQNGYELEELHNVSINAGTLANGDVIKYNSTTQLRENGQPTGGISGSGASGQVAYWTGTSAQSGSNNLFWDAANGRLGIGTNAPAVSLDVTGNTRINGTLNVGINTITSRSSLWSHIQNGNSSYVSRTSDSYVLFGRNFYRDAADNIIYITNSTSAAFDITARDFSFYSAPTGTAGNAITFTKHFQLFGATGNLVLQNGGTFTDGGQRLQVQGTTLLNGNVTFSSATGMFWDATNSRLGIGLNNPASTLHVYRTATNSTSAPMYFSGTSTNTGFNSDYGVLTLENRSTLLNTYSGIVFNGGVNQAGLPVSILHSKFRYL